jgi:hypothetical protein
VAWSGDGRRGSGCSGEDVARPRQQMTASSSTGPREDTAWLHGWEKERTRELDVRGTHGAEARLGKSAVRAAGELSSFCWCPCLGGGVTVWRKGGASCNGQ